MKQLVAARSAFAGGAAAGGALIGGGGAALSDEQRAALGQLLAERNFDENDAAPLSYNPLRRSPFGSSDLDDDQLESLRSTLDAWRETNDAPRGTPLTSDQRESLRETLDTWREENGVDDPLRRPRRGPFGGSDLDWIANIDDDEIIESLRLRIQAWKDANGISAEAAKGTVLTQAQRESLHSTLDEWREANDIGNGTELGDD